MVNIEWWNGEISNMVSNESNVTMAIQTNNVYLQSI